MSGFKDMVAADNKNVFLNAVEFAEKRTVVYDGETYANIPVVLSGIKEQDRRQLVSDHVQGLFLASTVMHCAVDDIGGETPEKGQKIQISDGGFMRRFYVATSICELGMVRLELEAISE